MLTNMDATLYHRMRGRENDGWQKTYLPAVWWYENIAASITTNGLKITNGLTNVLTVRIPDVSIDVKKGEKGEKNYWIFLPKGLKIIKFACYLVHLHRYY